MTECQTNSADSAGTKEIKIVVNGESLVLFGDLTVTRLLAHLELDKSRVAVELNREIVRQPEWDTTPIPGGSELEIVQFVGGG